MHFSLLLCSVLLLVDVIYSIVYFEYTYFLELKKRFSKGGSLPFEFANQLQWEIKTEVGQFRRLVQSTYILWFVFTCLLNLWYLPVAITLVIAFTNFIYNKAYVSPFMLYFNLLIMSCCYGYTIVNLALYYFK